MFYTLSKRGTSTGVFQPGYLNDLPGQCAMLVRCARLGGGVLPMWTAVVRIGGGGGVDHAFLFSKPEKETFLLKVTETKEQST